MYHHDIMPDTLDGMYPWEKDIYVNMLIQKVSEENDKAKIQQSSNRAAKRR